MSEKTYYIGNTISLEFDLYKDSAKTILWDLSDYQIRFELFKITPDMSIRKASAGVGGGSITQIAKNVLIKNRFTVV